GSRADAREGGYPSLFRQKRTPRNGHGHMREACRSGIFWIFFGAWTPADDLLNRFLNEGIDFEVSAWEPARRCRPPKGRAQQACEPCLCRCFAILDRACGVRSKRADQVSVAVADDVA